MEPRFPRIAMMARDIFAIQAAGVGIEREFSIAGNFNVDNRTYSDEVLGALMIVNHAQSEENRVSKFDYFSIHARTTPVADTELDGERVDHRRELDSLVDILTHIEISDDEDSDEDDFDRFKELEEEYSVAIIPGSGADDTDMDIIGTPTRSSQYRSAESPSRTGLRTPRSSNLSSPLAKLSASGGGGGRISRRASLRISAHTNALVNGRPAQKRLRANTNGTASP
jgi:hAT family C-terminal dimerisation region